MHVAPVDTAIPSPASPLRPDLFEAIDASVKAIWGPVPVVPIMETGATDGLFLRNAGVPVYGFSGLFIAIDDVRAHGKDERILISSFDDGLDFTYDLLKRVGSRLARRWIRTLLFDSAVPARTFAHDPDPLPDPDVPRDHLVLREPERHVRIAFAHAIERRADVVIRHVQQQRYRPCADPSARRR